MTRYSFDTLRRLLRSPAPWVFPLALALTLLAVAEPMTGLFDAARDATAFHDRAIGETTVQAIGVKAIKNVTEILSFSAPAGTWAPPMMNKNITGAGCGGSGGDKLCASESSGGVAFGDLVTDADGWSYWTWVVRGGRVLEAEDQHYGLDYGPKNGRLISAAIPEPSAALVFGLGALIAGGAIRRR